MKIKNNIRGDYNFRITLFTMFGFYEIETKLTKNLITSIGEAFFTSRWVNDENGVIDHIVIGKGTKDPAKTDSNLIDETGSLSTTITNNVNNITMIANVNGSEINDTTEIGVRTTKDKLISRDVHKPIQVPYSSNVTINYIYSIQTGVYKSGFIAYTGYTNVYVINETESIASMFETDTYSGYTLQSNITNVNNTPGSYYQTSNGKLYVHSTDSKNPNTHDILITYRSG